MEIFVGTFNEKELVNGDDKKAISEAKERTNLTYIKNKIVYEKGVKVMKVWLTDNY